MAARPGRAVSALIAIMALAPLPILAVDPPLIDCPSTFRSGDTIGRNGFYVPSYPGTSLRDVTLYLDFGDSGPGTYQFSLTARAGSYDGAILGTAIASVTVGSDTRLPVTFTFANPAVTPGSIVTFQHAKVSGPGSAVNYGVQTNMDSCPVVETNDFTPPLSTFRRSGVAVRINGNSEGGYPKTMTIPAAASIHGANGTFFHTDAYIFNRYAQILDITARYRCFSGQNCGQAVKTFTLNGYRGMSFSDVVGTYFGAPETAGAIELSYRSSINDDALHVISRVYTPSLPNPTNGAAVLGYPGHAATGGSIFLALANNGGNRSSGFRTNAGAYNPYALGTRVTFSIYRNDPSGLNSGTLLGSYSDTWGPNEAKQVNDIFAAAGVGSAVTTDALMYVESALPVFPYITVIDNVTGDSVVQGPKTY